MNPSDKSNRYSDFLRTKFRRYSLGTIAVMFAAFVTFMAMNILITTVWGTQNQNRDIADFFNRVIEEYDQALYDLADNPALTAALEGDAAALQTATELLYTFTNNAGITSTFLLINSQGEIVSTSLYQNNSQWFQSNLLAATALDKTRDNPGRPYHTVSRLDYGYDQAGDYLFAIAVSDESGVLAGYILFDWKDVSVYEYVRAYSLDQVTITDRFDNIVFTTQKLSVDPMEKYPTGRYRLDHTGRWTATQNGIEYFVDHQTIRQGELSVFALASIVFQQQMLLYGSIFLVIASLLMICVMSYLIQYTTKRNLISIEELASAAQRIGNGDLSYRITSRSFDEFQMLGDALNLLTENLQQMILHNRELAHHQQVLELKQLESQFNPHFIYNTMEAIRCKILLEPASAAEMVFVFANLMRYSMNFGNEKVVFATDIAFLRDYLTLQKMRFGDRLHYSIDIHEPLLRQRLPKLLLQPLVENSLNHGARRTRKITLCITGSIHDGRIWLTVQDNGDGIPEGALLALRNSLAQSQPNSAHFGLYSVNRTVQLTYGEDYGIQIDSTPGKGTMITVSLPYIQEEAYV